MIIILSLVFLMFYKSPSVTYRGTQCSARKAKTENPDKKAGTSARLAETMDEDDEPQDSDDPLGFVPLSKEGEEQFANAPVKTKLTPAEIQARVSSLRDMIVETNRARFVGTTVTGTVASCTGGTKEPPKKPTEDCMFMFPAALA